MPDELPHPSPNDIASMLRVGLTDDTPPSELEEETMPVPDLDATLMVAAPSVTAGGSPSRIWQPPGVEELRKMLPQYEVEAFIARGGMGAVYKGVQTTLKRPVAIKVLPPEADDEALRFAERFKREAQAMARLSHPNIVAVHDAGQTASGLLYFVMEFVEGTDLAQLLAHEGNLPPERAVPIILAVCEALAFAHEEGIIHRDIKPSNVMIDQRGRVKVADFGLAKVIDVQSTMLTRSDVAMGTPDFVAPEALIPGTAVDGRADIYAVGVMLYQMLTGKIPRGRFALPSGVVPKVDKRFDAIVDKAMQTDREHRYSTASEMKKDMEKVATRLAPSTKTEAADAASSRSSVKKPLLVGIAAIAMVSIAAAWYALNQGPEASKLAGIGAKEPAGMAVSKPNAPSGTIFHPGKWVKPASTQWQAVKGSPEFRGNGEMKLGGTVMLADLSVAAVFMRGKLKLPPGSGYTFAHLRFSENEKRDEKRTLSIRRVADKADHWSLQVNRAGKHDDVTPEQPPKFDQVADIDGWIAFEFGAVGTTSFARIGSGPWVKQTDANVVTPGAIALIGDNATFRDLEVMMLDGLSEAEALKLAGVEANPMASPTSPQWQRVDFLKMAARKVSTHSSMDGETLHLRRDEIWTVAPPAMRDGAIRATVRWEAETNLPRLLTRMADGQKHYKADLRASGIGINLYDRVDKQLKGFYVAKAFQPGESVVFQFASIGSRHFVWVNGQLLGSVEDASETAPGSLALQANNARYESVEWLALDGIPEAEALKLVGMNGTPQWRDALAEEPLKSVVAKMAKSPDGYDFPQNSNRLFPAEGLQAGAVRWRGKVRIGWPELAIKESDSHQFQMGISRSTRRPYIADKQNPQVKNLAEAEEYPGYQPKAGEVSEVVVARFGGKLRLLVDGRQVCEAAAPASAPWQFAIIIHGEPVPATQSLDYINLDGLSEAEALKLAGASASSTPQVSASPPSLPPAVKLWESPASLPASSSFRWEDKALCIQDNTLRAPNVQLRDFILRLRVRMNASAHAALCLRLHESAKGRHSYELRVHPGNNALELLYVPDQGGSQTLERWNLLKAHAADDWMPLEVRVLGETIAVTADGSVLGTVRDDRVKSAGTIALRGEKDARFREIEYVPLDGLPEAEALKLLGVTEATSACRFPDGPPGFVKELTGHTGEVSGGQSITILADNRRMFTHAGRVAAGVDVNEVILWDVETGQQVWKRQLTEIKGVIGGSAVLSAVNQVVVIHRGPEFVLEFLDLESGRTIRQVKAEKPLAGTFATHLIAAPDGRRFMMLLYPAKTETGEPLLFQLWDAKAPSSVAQWEFDDGKGCAVHAAAWLDDSRYVVNGHNTTSDRRFHLVLDVNQPGKVRRVVAGNDEVEFSFAPVPGQPDHILTHLRGGGLAFYDLVKSEVVRKFSVPRLQRQLIFLDSQRVLGLSTEWGDALRLWETTSGRLLWEQKDERLCDGLAVSPDRRFAVTNVFVSNGLGQNRPGNKLLVWRLPKADAGPQPGVMTFGGHRYQFVPFMGSWTQAKAKAEAMGGHLATITSAEEHAWFLNNIAQYSEHVWLGGYKTPANQWAWVTGEPWKFTAWARHTDGVMEPMTSGKSPETSNETVLEFGWYGPFEKPGGWNDQADIERHPAESDSGFVVEWENSAKAP